VSSELTGVESPSADDDDRRDWVEFVRFPLGEREYGLELGRVGRILRDPDVTAVPGTDPTIAGVTNLGSEIPVVVDGRALLDLPARSPDSETVLLLLDRDEARPSGLLVDDVTGIEAHHVGDLRRPGDCDWDPPVGTRWFRAVAVGAAGERASGDEDDDATASDDPDRLTGVFDLDAVLAAARGQA
jgi:chemotaxis signal transduction protein